MAIHHQIMWIIFWAIVVGIMVLDLGLFQKFLYKKHHETMTFKDALTKTILYIFIALAFNAALWYREGHEAGMQFLAGYLIELSLSVDNLFVFLMIFSYFLVPSRLQNRVLFWGIIGALILRALFIYIGAALLERFHWITYAFGAFLVMTSIKMFLQKKHEEDPETNFAVKLLRKFFRVTKDYREDHFVVKIDKKLWVTPLFIVLVLVETTDVIFAFDSIPAVFSVTKDPFIVFTSNVFAIMGLRALYFCIANFMDKFIYLKPALCVILAFVGIKMLIAEFYEIPTPASLAVIVGCLLIATLASLYKGKK